MSSDEESAKRRKRAQRACDVCRRKKIRCDGLHMPNQVCSTCIASNMSCTYQEDAKRRGPPKAYVQSLENRIQNMEALLRKLCPDGDFSKELDGSLDSIMTSQSISPFPRGSSSQDHHVPLSTPHPIIPTSTSSSDEGGIPSSDEDAQVDHKLSDWLLIKNVNPAIPRYFGKSAGGRMVKNAMDLKNRLTGTLPVHPTSFFHEEIRGRRPRYWRIPSWEKNFFNTGNSNCSRYMFPEPDLLRTLVERYFAEINTIYPLLHRPIFDRSVRDRLHLRDDGFARVLLTVCAIASRFVDDPRVLSDGSSGLSAGWKYFNQVELTQTSLLAPPSLCDIQLYCLAVGFLHGSSAPQGSWSLVGVGIRLAQDIGAHRRKVYDSSPTTYNEHWKRAFWVLVCFDRGMSAGLGRPCAIQDEDFDLEMPIDCDDEFWEHPDPEQAFCQPPGKPSEMSFFICFIKLQQIISFALRTIYSINKSKILLGFVGEEWERKILSELNSALNKWVDSIPEHLRWDPECSNATFFHQSATLYAAYYMVQIMVHRPFIRKPEEKAQVAFPALAICTNAARACSRILDAHHKRHRCVVPVQIGAAFMSSIVLLVKIWGSKRGGATVDTAREMEDVYKCMNVLEQCESKWHLAGRLLDDVRELASVKELPVHSMPGPVSTSVPVGMHFPVKAGEGLNDAGVSFTRSTSNLSLPYSWPYGPNPDAQANPSAMAESFPICSIDPVVATPSFYGVSSSGSTIVSPPAPPGSSWWNGSTLTHALRQAPPTIDATHPNLTLSPSTSASFNSLDALPGMSTGDPLFAPDIPPGQMHVSNDEMEAWLKAPTGWQSDGWDSWVMSMTEGRSIY